MSEKLTDREKVPDINGEWREEIVTALRDASRYIYGYTRLALSGRKRICCRSAWDQAHRRDCEAFATDSRIQRLIGRLERCEDVT